MKGKDGETDRPRHEGERKGTMWLTKMEKEAGSQARHQPLDAGKGKAMGSSQNLHKEYDGPISGLLGFQLPQCIIANW